MFMKSVKKVEFIKQATCKWLEKACKPFIHIKKVIYKNSSTSIFRKGSGGQMVKWDSECKNLERKIFLKYE